jgi:hypothetical protein
VPCRFPPFWQLFGVLAAMRLCVLLYAVASCINDNERKILFLSTCKSNYFNGRLEEVTVVCNDFRSGLEEEEDHNALALWLCDFVGAVPLLLLLLRCGGRLTLLGNLLLRCRLVRGRHLLPLGRRGGRCWLPAPTSTRQAQAAVQRSCWQQRTATRRRCGRCWMPAPTPSR